MKRLPALWLSLRDSLWFLPVVIVLAAVLLAVGLVEVEPLHDDLALRWPHLFGAGAEGARGMLSAIATSMVTVAGVVFSITIVALSLAASQYSPRVLRTFMADRTTQVVLGAFVAIFAYCLVVLRTIRGPDEGGFVPSLAVLGGVGMAFIGIGLLICFIHHVASAIQVPYIVGRIAADTAAAIDRLYPSDIGEPAAPGATEDANGSLPTAWSAVAAPRSGYLAGVDGERLMSCAVSQQVVVRIVPHVGDFVIEGRPLLQVAGAAPTPAQADALSACLVLQPERNIHQDAPYGLQQLVDVALKALSPSVHDPTTAISCIDQIGALMVRLANRRIEGPYRAHEGVLRIIAAGPDHAQLTTLAFSAITRHVGDHGPVFERLITTLCELAEATADAGRRQAVRHQMLEVLACAERGGQAARQLQAWRLRCEAAGLAGAARPAT